MEIASIPNKKRKDLITIAILLLGLPLLVYASYQAYQFVTKASVEAKPNNVVLSNLTTSSVTVGWTTDVSSNGTVIPVVNGSEKSPVIDKRGSGKRYTHYVELTDLEPNTEYQFIIVSDSKKYTDEEGKNFTFKTAPITADTPTPNPIHGSVQGGSGDDVMLYAFLKDKSTYPVSAIMPTGGNWIMDLSALRTVSNKSLVITSDSTNLVLVAISGTNKGSVLEASFADLFDSNGKLKDVYSLTVAENTSIYSYFPYESQLETKPIETEQKTNTPVITSEDEEDDEVIEEPRTGERVFRIVKQLNWIDMVTGDGTTVTSNTGDSSIQITNLTDTGFTILWISEGKEEGYVRYGTTKTDLSSEQSDERDGLTTKGKYYTHSVSVTRLQPETEYFFEIVSGDNTYDNDGNKYTVETFSTLSSPPPFESVTGVVDEMPDHGEVILTAYIQDKDEVGSEGSSLKISTIIDENGKWILSIADSRTEDGLSYYEYTSGDTMNINTLTTFNTDTHSENMEGIDERDIEIVLSSSAESVSYTKVDLLDNYGVLGFSTGAAIVEGSTDSEVNVQAGTETPKTGVLDNYIYIILASLSLFVLGSLIYTTGMTKPKRKGKMVTGL